MGVKKKSVAIVARTFEVDAGQIDIQTPVVEVTASADGRTLWVNTGEHGCLLRIQGIRTLAFIGPAKVVSEIYDHA